MGASRSRLVRQMMIESLLLAFGGSVFGFLFAWNSLDALVAVMPNLMEGDSVRLDGAVLLIDLRYARKDFPAWEIFFPRQGPCPVPWSLPGKPFILPPTVARNPVRCYASWFGVPHDPAHHRPCSG